jgi:hypothetical protein
MDYDYFLTSPLFLTGKSRLSFDCNPGMSFTIIGSAAACVFVTWTLVQIATTCVDNSIMLGPPAFGTGGSQTWLVNDIMWISGQITNWKGSTGTDSPQTCHVGLIYENLDESTPPQNHHKL